MNNKLNGEAIICPDTGMSRIIIRKHLFWNVKRNILRRVLNTQIYFAKTIIFCLVILY